MREGEREGEGERERERANCEYVYMCIAHYLVCVNEVCRHKSPLRTSTVHVGMYIFMYTCNCECNV